MTELPLPLTVRAHRASLARPAIALAALVLASAALRLVAVVGRATHRYFPDEFMYGQLARSLADGEGYAVLGDRSSFPSPLQPLVTSLTWLPGDPELAFRLTQGINAVAMSLAAIPVFLLCRRLGLGSRTALLAAVAAVAVPDLLYAGYVTADAIGYLLALAAIDRAVAAISRPSGRSTAAFLLLAALATLDRVQYAALLVAVVPAAIAAERSVRRAARRHAVLIGLGTALVAGGLVLSQVGPYAAVASFRLDGGTAAWVPRSFWGLALACGAVVVPGAVTWLVHELWSRTDGARSAFATITGSLVLVLVAASALMADQTGSERFFERYLMVLLPLVVVAFACWADSGARAARAAAGVALAITVAAMVAPVSSLVAGQGRADSPFLLAVGRLEDAIGVGSASLAVALGATVAAWLGVGIARRGAAPALLLTTALFAAVSVGAHAADRRLSATMVESAIGEPGWIDDVAGGPVVLVHGPGSDRATSMVLALRNRSVRDGVVLGSGTEAFPGFGRRARLDAEGRLLIDGSPVTRPAVFDDRTTRVVGDGGSTVAGPAGTTLVRPVTEVRLDATVRGLGDDGGLAPRAVVTLYPSGIPGRCRTLTLAVTAPTGEKTVTVVTDGDTLSVPPGETRRLVVSTGRLARRVVVTSSPVTALVDGVRRVTATADPTVATTPCADRRNG